MNDDKVKGPPSAPGEAEALQRYEQHKKEIAEAERAEEIKLERRQAAVQEAMERAEQKEQEQAQKTADKLSKDNAAALALEALDKGKPLSKPHEKKEPREGD